MKAFEYAAPRQESEVVSLLSPERGTTEILAGGTDLIGLMKQMIVTPERVVNIKEVESLKGVRASPQGVTIGAATALDEVLDAPELDLFAAVKQVLRALGSMQLTCQGTLSGELCQRPAC